MNDTEKTNLNIDDPNSPPYPFDFANLFKTSIGKANDLFNNKRYRESFDMYKIILEKAMDLLRSTFQTQSLSNWTGYRIEIRRV